MAGKKHKGLSIEMTLDKHTGTHPADVRVWVDENDDEVLDGPEKVAMKPDSGGALKWTGKFKFAEPRTTTRLLLRLHVYGTKGAELQVKVADIDDASAKITRASVTLPRRRVGAWYRL